MKVISVTDWENNTRFYTNYIMHEDIFLSERSYLRLLFSDDKIVYIDLNSISRFEIEDQIEELIPGGG